jgi:GNAT superfamily N-acetyltransferase
MQRMKFEIVPAYEVPFSEQAKIFNAAFAGYVGGSFELTPATLVSFASLQGIDLCYSRFARNRSGDFVSFGYISRTGNFPRLAGMGTVAVARRSGAAAFVLSALIEEAQSRGDQAMILEVIEQNPPAVALYQAHGFGSLTRLIGWRGNYDPTCTVRNTVREISIQQALQLPARWDYPELPWQISRYAVAKIVGARAYALDDVAIVIGDPKTAPIRLHGFPGFDGTNWERLRDLTSAVLAQFPKQEFHAIPVFPEQFGTGLFEPLKFRQEKISQFLMRKDF